MTEQNIKPEHENSTITEAVTELQKVVSHNAKVTMNQYENLINGTRLNNLLINAIIRKVGLSPEEVKEECEIIKVELEKQAKEMAEAEATEDQPADGEQLSMSGGEGDHPPEAVVFGDD